MELCRRYRKGGGAAGIIMLTAKGHVDDKESGLDAGADDYMTKPFQLKELAARVRAVLRRNHGQTMDVIKFRDLEIDIQEFKVTKEGKEVHLLPKEFRLLIFFAASTSGFFGRGDLASVWNQIRKRCSTPSAVISPDCARSWTRRGVFR